MRQGITLTYLYGDHLGSTSLATDANGVKIGELRYTPYGGTRYTWGATPTDHRFTDQQELAALGLYDYGARMYSPSLGRFLSADTIVPNHANPQLFNRYSYAGNNPVLHNDPTGHCIDGVSTWACIAFAVAILTAVSLGCHYSVPPTETPFPTRTKLPLTATSTPRPTWTPTSAPTPNPVSGVGFGSPVGAPYMRGWGYSDNHNGVDMVGRNDPDYLKGNLTNQPGPGLKYIDPSKAINPSADKVAGREVYAVAGGTIATWSDGNERVINLFTNADQGTRYQIQYVHVYPRSGLGTIVQQGELLGYYANIGGAGGIPHLHISYRRQVGVDDKGQPIWGPWLDPEKENLLPK